MPTICPVSDLKNKLDEIAQKVHESSQPVFLTEKGYGNMVLLSQDAWEDLQFKQEIDLKLMEASIEAITNPKRLTHEEVFGRLREKYPYVSEIKDA